MTQPFGDLLPCRMTDVVERVFGKANALAMETGYFPIFFFKPVDTQSRQPWSSIIGWAVNASGETVQTAPREPLLAVQIIRPDLRGDPRMTARPEIVNAGQAYFLSAPQTLGTWPGGAPLPMRGVVCWKGVETVPVDADPFLLRELDSEDFADWEVGNPVFETALATWRRKGWKKDLAKRVRARTARYGRAG